MSNTKASPIPEIPGVEYLDEVEEGARPLSGPYYIDQIETLVAAAMSARDRTQPGRIFIAPEGDGFTIYRRAK